MSPTTLHPINTMKRYLFFLALLLLLTTPALAGAADTKEANAPVPVSVVIAGEEEIPVLAEIVGTVQAAERAAIAAKVTGVITRMPVVLGSTVQTGDLLIAISAEEISARLNQAEAELARAKRNLEREQNLLLKNAATAETVKSMQDLHAIAQAGYREAKTMLGYTTITAPFAGVVTRKNVNTGDLATPGTVLLQIENNQRLQVTTAVPESLVLQIRTGDVLIVKVPAASVVVKGIVTEIGSAADPSSRTAPVTLDLPANPNLRSGQFARVLLPGKEGKTLLIPATALVPSGQMDRVFVVTEERARLRLVRTGRSHDGLIEILSGLDAGETVVVSNNQRLVNGQRLQIQP
jgi:RND family efflux transporter MFP subunit